MQSSVRLGLVGIAMATCLIAGSASAAEPAPVGYWKTIDDETGKPKSVVQIVERGGKLYGTIVRLFRAPGEDQNPVCDKCEGERKDKPIIGMQILENLSQDGDEWSGGKILDPNNGKTYKCYIEAIEGGSKLKVRGYIGFSLLGRTQYWHRVPSAEGT